MTSLRVAPLKKSTSHNTNQWSIGVYVSHLDPKTTSAEVAVHVLRYTSLTVRPFKLKAKHPSYSSFFISANKRQQETLLDAKIWPQSSQLRANGKKMSILNVMKNKMGAIMCIR